MQRAIRLRETRSDRWRREGERSIWQNISMIGSLGWLIVTPTLLGLLLGHWLDRAFATGIFYSGAGIFLGVAAGAYLAWKRMNKA